MPPERFLFDSIETARRHSPFFIEEDGLGIWLFSDRTDLPDDLPRLAIGRDAIHLPSVEKSGAPLPDDLILSFLSAARALGLSKTHRARGYWTLSDSGELQDEDVLIAFSDTPVDPNALHTLAVRVLETGKQDAVAYEVGGRVLVAAAG